MEHRQHALVHRPTVVAMVVDEHLAIECEADEGIDVDEDDAVDKHPHKGYTCSNN